MTKLIQRMREELVRRNYAETTIRSYLQTMEDFRRFAPKRLDHVGSEEIRKYQVHLIEERKLEAGTVAYRVAALRFFYVRTLKRSAMKEDLPYPHSPKHARRLPTILTQEEVSRLIDSARNLFHYAMLLTMYSAGLRRSELCKLKVSNIDSGRMVIRIERGKGGVDREVPLNPKLLTTLREYWRWMRPKTYLFPGTSNGWRADKPITPKVIWEAVQDAAERAGIEKHVTPHTLRHASAYYTTFPSLFILKAIGLGLVFAAIACTSLAQQSSPVYPLQPGTLARDYSPAAEPESKRIFWIIPNYRTCPTLNNFKPLTAREKFRIATEDSFDRGTFALAAIFGGFGQLTNSNRSFGQGAAGYAKYYGASFADFAIGDYMTEAIYPSLLHQDPRYFRQGTGSHWSRFRYAAGQIFFTHTDSGTAQFNYSEILGNSTAVAISNAYYSNGRTASDAISRLGTQLGIDMAANVLKEFWPEVERKFRRKHHAGMSATPQ